MKIVAFSLRAKATYGPYSNSDKFVKFSLAYAKKYQPTIYPRQPKYSGIQPTIYPRQLKYSGTQPTIYPTTDFLIHLILSYSFEIKQINERTHIYLKFFFKIMFLSHDNAVFVIKSKSKILINSLKSAYLS